MSEAHVYKIGGPALEDPGLVAPLADELRRVDGNAVLVHGGGRHVDRLLRALGIESRFVDGRRVTSPAAMEVVEMVLSGVVNKALAAGLTAAGRELREAIEDDTDARAQRSFDVLDSDAAGEFLDALRTLPGEV